MEGILKGYDPISEEEFKILWDEGVFVLDTNVLLNLYRWSEETREEWFNVLDGVRNQLWLPHQIALEYKRGRISAIASEQRNYVEIRKAVTTALNQAEAGVNRLRKQSLAGREELSTDIARLRSRIEARLDAARDELKVFLSQDKVLPRLTDLYRGKIGASYSDAELAEVEKEGKKRYEARIPPGHLKPDNYGDVVLWQQLVSFAESEKKPVILVQSEEGEDWWQLGGETEKLIIGPRRELLQEMWDRTGVGFYQYNPRQFLERASEFLGRQVDKNAVDEVESTPSRWSSASDVSALEKSAAECIAAARELRREGVQFDEQIRLLIQHLRDLMAIDLVQAGKSISTVTRNEFFAALPDEIQADLWTISGAFGRAQATNVSPEELDKVWDAYERVIALRQFGR